MQKRLYILRLPLYMDIGFEDWIKKLASDNKILRFSYPLPEKNCLNLFYDSIARDTGFFSVESILVINMSEYLGRENHEAISLFANYLKLCPSLTFVLIVPSDNKIQYEKMIDRITRLVSIERVELESPSVDEIICKLKTKITLSEEDEKVIKENFLSRKFGYEIIHSIINEKTKSNNNSQNRRTSFGY